MHETLVRCLQECTILVFIGIGFPKGYDSYIGKNECNRGYSILQQSYTIVAHTVDVILQWVLVAVSKQR